MGKKKISQEDREKRRRHNLCRKKIVHLLYRIKQGGLHAKIELTKELRVNPAASNIVKFNLLSNTIESFNPRLNKSRLKGKELPSYGNAYIFYSGGAPGLGKNS